MSSARPDGKRRGRSRIRTVVATLGAFALSALCVSAAFWETEPVGARTRRIALPDALVACATDEDCVLVDRIGCCTCETGGAQWAVNATQTDALRRFLKHACKNQPACLQIDACRQDLVAACTDGKCILRVAPDALGGPSNG